ncbi:MAG: CAP domain-containing protein, partial [Cyanobacteria bacterium]|nr:CAP domain-containing protein [Cyanobacteriota bacterium]
MVMENIGRSSRGLFEPDMRMLSNLHKSMMDEGPGGGHYEAIMNPNNRSVGIGIARSADRFYLVEEFSN